MINQWEKKSPSMKPGFVKWNLDSKKNKFHVNKTPYSLQYFVFQWAPSTYYGTYQHALKGSLQLRPATVIVVLGLTRSPVRMTRDTTSRIMCDWRMCEIAETSLSLSLWRVETSRQVERASVLVRVRVPSHDTLRQVKSKSSNPRGAALERERFRFRVCNTARTT